MRRLRTPQPTLDDTQLISAMRDGDADAASALYDRAAPTIQRALRRLLGRGDRDHDDLAQQVMIELVTCIDRFRGDCSLDSWISTITAHLVYKLFRRRKLERRIFDGSLGAGEHTEHTEDVLRTTSARSELVQIRKHLHELDEAKAWTFMLHDVLGYDLKEIAQITEVSVAAAQSRLVRGRKELHQRIAEDPQLQASFALTRLASERQEANS
jgi:RNA polymerase sigma-70 factor, ECF subfamily